VGLHRYHYDHHLHGHLRCYCCFVIFVVVGAETVQSMVITEPPVQRVSARALRHLHTGSPLTLSMYPSKGEWLCNRSAKG
jgi:hypothetical protein